jgi:porin
MVLIVAPGASVRTVGKSMRSWPRLLPLAATAALLLWGPSAIAQQSCTLDLGPTPAGAVVPAPSGFWQRTNLLGDMGGLRTELGGYGMTVGMQDTETLLGVATGGIKQGATLEGLTTGTLQVDTNKAFGLPRGTFCVSALQIHGKNLNPAYLDDLQTQSNTEAQNSTRLWELWYDQTFPRSGFDIKLGQQSLDQEFIISKYSGVFINTMAGWPLVPSVDLYAGGPAYPLSSLGVRGRATPATNITILAGVFDDNPPGGPFLNDPQSRDAGGSRFNLGTGALFLGELQVAATAIGLPGTYKLGFWYDTGTFPDQQFDDHGLSLADPASDGAPAMRHGNYSPYGVVDQTLWQPSGSARSLNAFVRLMGAPGDRNLVNFFANGGLTLTDPLPGRDNDIAGIDLGVGHVSGQAANLDRAQAFFSGMLVPVRGTETLVEMTYQMQLTPWWAVQPDFQYVFSPGGGILNPNQPVKLQGNAAVLGVRTMITF